MKTRRSARLLAVFIALCAYGFASPLCAQETQRPLGGYPQHQPDPGPSLTPAEQQRLDAKNAAIASGAYQPTSCSAGFTPTEQSVARGQSYECVAAPPVCGPQWSLSTPPGQTGPSDQYICQSATFSADGAVAGPKTCEPGFVPTVTDATAMRGATKLTFRGTTQYVCRQSTINGALSRMCMQDWTPGPLQAPNVPQLGLTLQRTPGVPDRVTAAYLCQAPESHPGPNAPDRPRKALRYMPGRIH